MILLLPEKEDPEKLPTFVPKNDIGASAVAEQRNLIFHAKLPEQCHRLLGRIGREGVKFVMIAGPSSSGKTSFSHRLSIQLRTYGLKPHPIGLDNYYLNHDKTVDSLNDQNIIRSQRRDLTAVLTLAGLEIKARQLHALSNSLCREFVGGSCFDV